MNNIGILGAGTWGLALARLLAKKGAHVTCWSIDENELNALRQHRQVARLGDMVLPDAVFLTSDLKSTVENQDVLVCAVPSLYVRETFRKAAPYITQNQIIVDVSKGIEKGSLMLLSSVIADELAKANRKVRGIAVLTGPTHAEEVAADLPTAIVAACKDEAVACYVQDIFMTTLFRVYTNIDVDGAELCGALKNVIALAVGIALGLGYGDNTKAALMTRGMAEIARLGTRMGCDSATFYGLCGMGDLIVTCTSKHSRNLRFGMLIGQGFSVSDALKQVGMVVEGVNALDAAMALSQKYRVEMPIVAAAYRILRDGMPASATVSLLMQRERKGE